MEPLCQPPPAEEGWTQQKRAKGVACNGDKNRFGLIVAGEVVAVFRRTWMTLSTSLDFLIYSCVNVQEA